MGTALDAPVFAPFAGRSSYRDVAAFDPMLVGFDAGNVKRPSNGLVRSMDRC
jgi:hypothetical protein